MPAARRRRSWTYLAIANDLEGRIADGEWEVDEQLPSYNQLATAYKVSFATVARAIAILRDRRVVYGHPGKGTFVAEEE